MNLPKRNSADGRCYWMKPEAQEELQLLFDQCIQDAVDGKITRLGSLWEDNEIHNDYDFFRPVTRVDREIKFQ